MKFATEKSRSTTCHHSRAKDLNHKKDVIEKCQTKQTSSIAMKTPIICLSLLHDIVLPLQEQFLETDFAHPVSLVWSAYDRFPYPRTLDCLHIEGRSAGLCGLRLMDPTSHALAVRE